MKKSMYVLLIILTAFNVGIGYENHKRNQAVIEEHEKQIEEIENLKDNADFELKILEARKKIENLELDEDLDSWKIGDNITSENKAKLSLLKDKQEEYKKKLAELEKEPTDFNDVDYENEKLNAIKNENNKKIKTQREELKQKQLQEKQKATTSKKESKPESKPQTTSDNTVQQAKQPEKVNYSVTYNGEVYPIVHGYQDRVDARHKEWVNTMDSMNPEFDIPYKYVGDNRNIWLAAHTDAYGSSIKDAQVITYTDPDGNQKDYAFYGYLEDLPMGGEVFYDDDPIVPWIEGTAGDYLVFQICTDYSYGRGIAIGYVFAPVE